MNLPNSTNASTSTEDCLDFVLQAGFLPSVIPSAVFAVIANTICCPFIILLNVLVIVAVKTKQQLKMNSNVVLACLSSTDLLVGIIVQPFYITFLILSIGEEKALLSCTLQKLFVLFTAISSYSSLYHLVIISGERYFSMKRSFTYQSFVTKATIIRASVLAWTLAIVTVFAAVIDNEKLNFRNQSSIFVRIISVLLITYCHVVVYFEVKRHEKQIIQQQVSLEDKIKMRREMKAFKTTSIIIGTLALCNAPSLAMLLPYHLADIKTHVPLIAPISGTLLKLNSLFNPIIYTVRKRQFRVAFIQLLTRESIARAEAIERQYFGRPRRTAVEVLPGQRREEKPAQHGEQQNESKTDTEACATREESNGGSINKEQGIDSVKTSGTLGNSEK